MKYSEAEKRLLSSWERILIELLDGPLRSGELAERVDVSPQQLSRVLPRLTRNQLIFSRFPDVRRINRLTSKGTAIAEAALVKRKALRRTLPAEELRELELWVHGMGEREWSPKQTKK